MDKLDKKEGLYIFIHVPKTGGTSFNANIKVNQEYADSPNIPVAMGHEMYYGIHENYNTEKEPRYIMFFRDPLERTLSHFKFNTENRDTLFKDWFTQQYENFQTKWLMEKLLGKHGEPTEYDVENIKLVIKKRMWHVGLTEDLDKELPLLLNKIGFKAFDEYLHSNKNRKEYVFNKEEEKLVKKHTKFDQEIYDYIKELKREGKWNLDGSTKDGSTRKDNKKG